MHPDTKLATIGILAVAAALTIYYYRKSTQETEDD